MKCTERYLSPKTKELVKCGNEAMPETEICMLHAENIRIRLQMADFAEELKRLRLKVDNLQQYISDTRR